MRGSVIEHEDPGQTERVCSPDPLGGEICLTVDVCVRNEKREDVGISEMIFYYCNPCVWGIKKRELTGERHTVQLPPITIHSTTYY